jgi:phosphoglucosamine mutase
MARLFGTDGIRGAYGRELTPELTRALGRAAVRVLAREHGRPPTLLIGRDTRPSGTPLEEALVEGILEEGGDAVLAGIVPTPAVAFLVPGVGAESGIVISASHNQPGDNGIKFLDAGGYKLSDRLEGQIEDEMGEGAGGGAGAGARTGRVHPLPPDAPSYLDHVVGVADGSLHGMRVVVDCANGAASGFAPDVLRKLGADVVAINADGDGARINVGSGALFPERVAETVVALGAHAGVAYDGDADRAMFADAGGRVIDGDQVLAASAIEMQDRGTLTGGAVVATVMANTGFHRAMEEHGIRVVSAPVGDRYVLERMLEHDLALGGEQSGHVIFREHATTGDGLVTAVRFLSLAAARDVSVGELAEVMQRFPQVMINVEVADKERLDSAEEVWKVVRARETQLDGNGRVLVRASGTEPLIRVMVEAETEQLAREHAEAVAERVAAALG